MRAYRVYTTVNKARKLVLSDIPFQEGQRVEVVVLADDRQTDLAEARALFAESQATSLGSNLSDEEIREEIAAYRAGK